MSFLLEPLTNKVPPIESVYQSIVVVFGMLLTFKVAEPSPHLVLSIPTTPVKEGSPPQEKPNVNILSYMVTKSDLTVPFGGVDVVPVFPPSCHRAPPQ